MAAATQDVTSCKVKLQLLVKRHDLNGEVGVAESFSDGRYLVRMGNTGECVRVKPENLILIAADVCWGCGVVAKGKARFKQCAKCVDANLVPGLFCSQACLTKNWPRHKAWHKERDDLYARFKNHYIQANDTNTRDGDATNDEYLTLCLEARHLIEAQQYKQAVKKLWKAVKLEPDQPAAYRGLHTAYGRCNDPVRSAENALRATELLDNHRNYPGNAEHREWALSLGSMINSLAHPSCTEVRRPEWWTLAQLDERTRLACDAASDDEQAWRMRGMVLLGLETELAPFPQHAATLREASSCLRRSLAIGSGQVADPAIRAVVETVAGFCDTIAMNFEPQHWNDADGGALRRSRAKELCQARDESSRRNRRRES
eukprot:5223172-Prymnesium_polylepis.1